MPVTGRQKTFTFRRKYSWLVLCKTVTAVKKFSGLEVDAE